MINSSTMETNKCPVPDSEWITVAKNKPTRNLIDKELIPAFTEISKKDFDFLLTGKCHFIRYDKDRTPLNEVFIPKDGPFNYRFYVAINQVNLIKILFTQVQEDESELEYFANWMHSEMEIKHFNCKVVYLAHDTVDGYQMKVSVDFVTEAEKDRFVELFYEGIENDAKLKEK